MRMREHVLRGADLAGIDYLGESICGIDEAGRGPLAGPVCAASVVLPDDFPVAVLDDSKALSSARRERAYELIVSGSLDWAIAWATYGEIGELNILRASLLAMRRSFLALRARPSLVLVDGNALPPDLETRAFAVIGGDGLIPAIMAASILAKVARDRLMDRLDGIEPIYGFARNRGYPTAAHREAIKKTGPSLWARPGFRIT
jgi:ribonuclease HII